MFGDQQGEEHLWNKSGSTRIKNLPNSPTYRPSADAVNKWLVNRDSRENLFTRNDGREVKGRLQTHSSYMYCNQLVMSYIFNIFNVTFSKDLTCNQVPAKQHNTILSVL